MTIKILFFGPLADKVSASAMELEDMQDTDTLMEALHTQYPSLMDIQFSLSVNRKIIHQNTPLHHEDEVACLPPFSGG
jgi:molybdopterin synthase sulfur carrier subunit